MIPADWDVQSFDSLFNVSGGVSASRDQLGTTGHCYLHYGDIHTTTDTFVDVRAKYLDLPKLDIPLQNVSAKFLLQDGDVVFVDASEDDIGASRHIVVVNDGDVPFIAGLHTIVAKSKTAALDKTYRRYCFQTSDIRRQFLFYAVGTKVTGISKSNIKKLRVPLPPPSEQRAIAEALSDVDGLLGALEALIAKKQAIKQSAMQRLLTGTTRLPGFSGEWEMKQIGDVADIKSGATPNTQVPDYWNGTIPWCTPTDITGTSGKYLSTTERSISEAGLASCAANLLRAGSLLLCSRATIGEVRIAATQICTNQGFKSLVCRAGVSNEFLYYLVLTLKPQMIERSIGSTFLELGKRDLASIAVKIPKENEQDAIAAVLSDMDAEIVALEQRREKTRAIKQGMMQQLLTGRIRLTKPLPSQASA